MNASVLKFLMFLRLAIIDDCGVPRPYHNITNGTGIRWQLSRKMDCDPQVNLSFNRNVPALFFRWHFPSGSGAVTLINAENWYP